VAQPDLAPLHSRSVDPGLFIEQSPMLQVCGRSDQIELFHQRQAPGFPAVEQLDRLTHQRLFYREIDGVETPVALGVAAEPGISRVHAFDRIVERHARLVDLAVEGVGPDHESISQLRLIARLTA
jgi:hypothetical protein